MQGQAQMGARAPPSPFFFLLLVIYIYIYIYIILVNAPFQNLKPFSNSNYPTQKFKKNNKNIHNGDCILAK